ncbi:MAG: hypothetical protein ACOYPS_03990, partial [Phycisphaerales bacterium]
MEQFHGLQRRRRTRARVSIDRLCTRPCRIERAVQSRPELMSLERQSRALGASVSATRAGMFPSLSGQFSVDLANPNQ